MKPSILLYSAEFIKVFLVLIILTCLTQWFYLNCRQILKILGFFSEPQQAPISFVPATLQTADATSSLPGATLMWVRCCSTNRMHIQIFVDSSDMGLWNGAWTLRHAAILWWQVAISEVHKEMSTTKRYWLEQPRWLFGVMSGDCALGLDSMNWSPSKLYSSCTIHRVRQAGAGGWSWSAVREKHCSAGWSWRNVRKKYCSSPTAEHGEWLNVPSSRCGSPSIVGPGKAKGQSLGSLQERNPYYLINIIAFPETRKSDRSSCIPFVGSRNLTNLL